MVKSNQTVNSTGGGNEEDGDPCTKQEQLPNRGYCTLYEAVRRVLSAAHKELMTGEVSRSQGYLTGRLENCTLAICGQVNSLIENYM
jgi:hypothetical protein